ncbi:MAG: ComEC family competence protein, partial [Desulfofustis sp.]|nr:ComEC family competence protein [Desulfofustis sp.]
MKVFINHCRSNLLLCLTLLFAAGIMVRDTLAAAPLVFLLPILATLALTSWLIRRETIALVLLCCCFFLFGSLRGNQQQTRIGAPAAIETLAKDEAEVVLIGRLAALVADDGLSIRALIDVDHLKKAADQYFQPIRVRLLLRLKDRWPDAFLQGDELAVRARLRLPHIGSIPGTFDYRQYLARRDITAIAMVASPLLIAPADNQLADDSRPGRYWIERIRTIIGNHLDSLLDQPAAGLYRALLIGDRSRIAPDTMESFKGAGVAHILAISGMHLGLLGFFSFQTISWLMRRSEYLT